MSISESIVADFTAEADLTRAVLEAVPEGRWDWKPHEKSMTLQQLAGHIANIPTWGHAMMQPEMDFEVAEKEFRPFVPESSKELLDTFDANVASFKEAATGKDDAFMMGTWTMRRGKTVIMALPRAVAIRSWIVHHPIHHRGQLTVYLRLLGVAVPSTYGQTADAPNMTT